MLCIYTCYFPKGPMTLLRIRILYTREYKNQCIRAIAHIMGHLIFLLHIHVVTNPLIILCHIFFKIALPFLLRLLYMHETTTACISTRMDAVHSPHVGCQAPFPTCFGPYLHLFRLCVQDN